MDEKEIAVLKFSASHTADRIVEEILSRLKMNSIFLPFGKPAVIQKDQLLLAVFPVFSGRLPEFCAAWLKQVQGSGGPAVAVVVYGNRDYDDALLELTEGLRDNHFQVGAAAAVIGSHSIITEAAGNRPDGADLIFLDQFCSQLQHLQFRSAHELSVPGQHPYRKAAALPLKPETTSACIRCGRCAEICPVHAIDPQRPEVTDRRRCQSCTACIADCPVHARRFPPLRLKAAAMLFRKKVSQRKEPEMFL